MKKRPLTSALAALFASALALVGCASPNVPDSSNVPDNSDTGTQSASSNPFTRIEITEFGSSATGERYVAESTDDGVVVSYCYVYMGSEDEVEVVDQQAYDQSVYEQLVAVCDQVGLASWDGFHGSNSDVMDGSSFTLEATMADGSTVSASGTNSFPKGYSDLKEALRSLITV